MLTLIAAAWLLQGAECLPHVPLQPVQEARGGMLVLARQGIRLPAAKVKRLRPTEWRHRRTRVRNRGRGRGRRAALPTPAHRRVWETENPERRPRR